MGLVRRTLQAQGRFAFQDVQLKLAKESITEAEFQNRRKDAKAAGKVQKMLLEAAADGRDKAMAMLEDGEAEVNDYDVDDLQDAENRLDDNDETSDEHEILVQSLSFEDTDPTPGTKPEVAAVAHACRTLMNVLVGQAESVKVEKPCHLCQLDPTVDQKMKDNVYMPAKLQVHQSWSFHSPKKAWLRRWKGSKNKCPYPDCDTQGTPEQLLAHVLERKGQSDQHLLAAARDGMFARDFDPKATATGEVSVKAVGGGKYKMVAPEDPTEVDIAAMIPPRNLSKDGEFLDEPQARAPVKNEPTLRLPTKTPLTQTAWWPEHETGIEGAVTDTLHAQQEFLMKLADKNLRDLGKGQANAKGETATRASHGKGKKRQEAIKHLRKRLVELGWRWGADTANQVDEEDEEEEFQGFPDDDDPDADGTVD